jgi:mannose-6-phosphate isomerase
MNDTSCALRPLRLQGYRKSAIWGGDRLCREWSKPLPDGEDNLAESWELSVREKENCRIAGGPFDGLTLREYLTQAGTRAVSPDWDGGRFPLLVKLIDANDRLSVQVHPDDAYAAVNENDTGKTEVWYVLDAEPGAEIVYGLLPGATPEDFARATREGDPERVLNRLPAKAGDVFFLPSGMPHAIGAGILIAEIQQNCDLTYRVYDYNRRQPDGSLRALHVKQAMEVVRPFTQDEVNAVRFAAEPAMAQSPQEASAAGVIAACPYFRARRVSLRQRPLLSVTEASFLHLLCVEGSGTLCWQDESFPLQRGDSLFLPAGCGAVKLFGEGEVVVSSL